MSAEMYKEWVQFLLPVNLHGGAEISRVYQGMEGNHD
jgi:hypothetical protein